MPTPEDPTRLPGLKAALAKFGDEERISQQQVAEFYGVTNARITTLIKQRFAGFPPPERHADKTNWYPARAAISCMIGYLEDAKKGRRAQAKRHSAIMGHVADERADAAQQPEPLSAVELDKLYAAATKEFRLRQLQGQYVLASEVTRIAREVNQLLARDLMNLVNELDPNGELPPRQREQLKTKSRAIVLKMHDALGAYLEDDAQHGRTGGATVARAGIGRNQGRARVRANKGPVPSAA